MGRKLLVSDVLTTGSTAGRINNFLFAKISRLDLEFAHSPVHLVLRVPALEVK
jgi:hypothetical protein